MLIFHIHPAGVQALNALPTALPEQGYLWIAPARTEFEAQLPAIQAALPQLGAVPLLDLHVSDLLNAQLPSHYDYTSDYDVLVFRRLAAGHGESDVPAPEMARLQQSSIPVLRHIDTSPVGFAVFDRVLLSVHPADCAVRDAYAAKLLASVSTDARMVSARMPTSPADLMLRVVNMMVDGYLDLRRELTRQMDHWQDELMKPQSRFTNWSAVLQARMALHHLEEICEDQRAALQDWNEAVMGWPINGKDAHASEPDPVALRERDQLLVRSRDVLEHIERVVHHVNRLEQGAETAVQMHFSVQNNATNDTMRVLTALTAVFLPLNFITGFFGMNFEFLPFIHQKDGLYIALVLMAVLALGLLVVFWRRRYLSRSDK